MPSRSDAVGRQGFSLTVPIATRAEKDDINAAMIEHFDPVQMTLPEIEAMQAKLAELAAMHRREEEGPPEGAQGPVFAMVRDGDWKECGELEGIVPEEDELEPFLPEGAEEDWRWLDEG